MDLNGVFNTEARTPMGVMKLVMTLTVTEGVFSGSIESSGQKAEFTGGKVDGDAFEFDAMLPSPMGAAKCHVTGSIERDTISGKVKIPFGVAKFKGTRA